MKAEPKAPRKVEPLYGGSCKVVTALRMNSKGRIEKEVNQWQIVSQCSHQIYFALQLQFRICYRGTRGKARKELEDPSGITTQPLGRFQYIQTRNTKAKKWRPRLDSNQRHQD
ncbi:MAG: hypothetical protein DRG31_04885 [Deltaproteobacteria bacterium]|nr:MAG: hypothetical protein DRG31_04885 [Deltaproteobacteria bacterium]